MLWFEGEGNSLKDKNNDKGETEIVNKGETEIVRNRDRDLANLIISHSSSVDLLSEVCAVTSGTSLVIAFCRSTTSEGTVISRLYTVNITLMFAMIYPIFV